MIITILFNKKPGSFAGYFSGTSAANVGVAAHECGHALQHQQHYIPLQIRMSSVYATNFASQAVLWIPLIALFTHIISMYVAIWIIAVCMGILMLFQPHHAAGRVRRERARQGGSSAVGNCTPGTT